LWIGVAAQSALPLVSTVHAHVEVIPSWTPLPYYEHSFSGFESVIGFPWASILITVTDMTQT
jgi:hypothetical protein